MESVTNQKRGPITQELQIIDIGSWWSVVTRSTWRSEGQGEELEEHTADVNLATTMTVNSKRTSRRPMAGLNLARLLPKEGPDRGAISNLITPLKFLTEELPVCFLLISPFAWSWSLPRPLPSSRHHPPPPTRHGRHHQHAHWNAALHCFRGKSAHVASRPRHSHPH